MELDRRDVQRLAGLAKGAVELGLRIGLLPLKLALRAVRPQTDAVDTTVATPPGAAAPSPTAPSPTAASPAVAAPSPAADLPWPGYDGQNVAAITARLRSADPAQRAAVRRYEESHKRRVGVLRVAGA